MKKIRNSLGLKTFLLIFLLLSLSCGSVYGLVMIFMPGSYRVQINQATEESFAELVAQLNKTGFDEEKITDFAKQHNVNVLLLDEQEVIVNSWGDTDTSTNKQADTNEFVQTVYANFSEQDSQKVEIDGELFQLSISYVGTVINHAFNALVRLTPYIILAIVFLSGLGSYLVYHFISKPVIKLSVASKKLAKLEFDGDFQIKQQDELGLLADNMSYLAENLSVTLADLQTANDQLKADVENEKKRKLQQKKFFSAVSHELKTPVTLIQCLLDGMINQIGTYRNRDKYLVETQQAVKELEELIKEIMTISMFDSDEFMRKEPVALSAIVNSYLLRCAKLIEAKQFQVQVDIEKDVYIYADAGMIKKAISNVIGNSIRHSPEGALLKIDLKSQSNLEAELVVQNFGVSIPPEMLTDIFEPFKRVEQSRNRNLGGSGLGLYIVHSILSKHAYDFTLENTEDAVKFTIVFPVFCDEKTQLLSAQ